MTTRHTQHTRRLHGAFALLAAALLASACSASVGVGTGSVAEKQVEQEAAAQLAAAVDNGVTPIIDCPGDLPAEVGAIMSCELTVEGDPTVFPVSITVTSVKDGKVNFTAEVGQNGG